MLETEEDPNVELVPAAAGAGAAPLETDLLAPLPAVLTDAGGSGVIGLTVEATFCVVVDETAGTVTLGFVGEAL